MLEEIRKGTTGALDKAKTFFANRSGSGDEPETLSVEAATPSQQSQAVDRLEELSELCPQLTFQQRLIGFAASFSLGYMIAFLSFRFFIRLVEGHPLPFALNYTFGHILQLMASTFLCGPKRQFKNMFDEKRRQTSIVYLSCLFLTLAVIFIPLPKAIKLIVLLLLMLTQFCASCWYTLSYIPYGRRTVSRCVKRQLGLEETADYSTLALPSIRLGGGVAA